MLIRKGNKICRKEGVVIGAVDEKVANNIDLVIPNDYHLYKHMRALVDTLVKNQGKVLSLIKKN